MRSRREEIFQTFINLFSDPAVVTNNPIEPADAMEAARIRAHYNLSLLDAFQAAIAVKSRCGAFLTNDKVFQRIEGLNVVMVDELIAAQTN